MRNARRVTAVIAAAVIAMPLSLWGRPGGVGVGSAGVPGEGTCASCHSGTVNSGPGNVTVAFPGGMNYTSGATQRLTVTITDSTERRWGFQLAARLAGNTKTQAGSFKPADGNTATVSSGSLQNIQQTSAGTRPGTPSPASFAFDWTPPATGTADVGIYVSALAANNDGGTGGDHTYTAGYTISAVAPGGGQPVIAANGVVNGAAFTPAITSGSWVTIVGANLAPTTRTLTQDDIVNGSLPTQLGGVAVTIDGRPAFLSFVSPTQINALAPSDSNVGPVPVVVASAGSLSDPGTAQLQPFSPGFFLFAGKFAVATRTDFTLVAATGLLPGVIAIPAQPGEIIILWGTGFGPTAPDVPAGQIVDSATVHNIINPPVIQIGGVTADYISGALAPGFAGLYQIAVRVPPGVPDGELAVTAEVGGLESPSNVFLTVKR